MDIFELSGEELDRIEEVGMNVGTDMQFATSLLPIGVSFTVTLLITETPNVYVFAGFVATTAVSYTLGIYFGFRWWGQRDRFRKLIAKLKERRPGPLGEEGGELRLSELAELPREQPAPFQIPILPEEPGADMTVLKNTGGASGATETARNESQTAQNEAAQIPVKPTEIAVPVAAQSAATAIRGES